MLFADSSRLRGSAASGITRTEGNLWAKGGGGAKDSHIICSAALESILNVDVASVIGGPWRKGTGGSVAYGWGTSKDECSWAMGGDLKLGEVGIDIEVINGLLCTVVGVIVRSSSLSNPLFSDRQSCRFKRNLFLFDVADLLELLLCTLPAGLLTSILMLRSVGVEAGSLLTLGGPTPGGTGVNNPPDPVGTGDADDWLFDKLVGVVFRLPCLLRGTVKVDWDRLGSISKLC